jgi:hypothetical protein
MTGTEPIEVEELSGRVLEIIGAYRMDTALDPRDLYPMTIAEATPEPVFAAGEGFVRDGVYHVADTTRWRRDGEVASRRRSPVRRAVAA